jgi:hypothetical protein
MKWFVRRKSSIVQAGIFKWQYPKEILSGPLDHRKEEGLNNITFKCEVQQWFRDNDLDYGRDYRSQFRQVGNGQVAVDLWFRDRKWAIIYKLTWGGV